MRLRIVELPVRRMGAAVTTPFLIVFDRCDDEEARYMAEVTNGLCDKTGAEAALVFHGDVDLD